MITIVDYGMGNLRSLAKAFEAIDCASRISSDPREIEQAERLVIPGVGAFGDAMENLRQRQLIGALTEAARGRKVPCLGICLGMQLLARSSEELGTHTGLGFIAADVRRIAGAGANLRIPHVGWNDVTACGGAPLLNDLPAQASFYFVHSFHVVCDNSKLIAGECTYGQPFAACVHHENLWGTQFHPEKSQANGQRLLRNWLAI
jgi:glutamine amidotransferase